MSDFLAQAGARLYPNMAPAAATESVEALAPASAPPAPATPPEAAGGQPEGRDNSFEAIAERRYGNTAEWTGYVDLNEPPPATAAEYQLNTSGDIWDRSETGKAAEGRMRDAFLAVGAPPSLARELWNDAAHAERGGFRPQSAEAAERELRAKWGDGYDGRMQQVRGVIRQATQLSPELMPFLERSGLCNNARFISKLAAFAGRRPKGA